MKILKAIYSFSLLLFLSAPLFAQDTLSFAYQIEKHRAHYKEDFLTNESSPFYGKKKVLDHLQFFAPDSAYAVDAIFELTPDAKPFEMATYSGMVKPYQKYGEFTFTLNGTKQKLAVYKSLRLARLPGFRDYLFLPFRDVTNGEVTYGGGRYLDFKTSDIVDGKMVLDFNKCYNPWCHYADGYNCPIPPQENHLEIEVLAGERNFGMEKKH